MQMCQKRKYIENKEGKARSFEFINHLFWNNGGCTLRKTTSNTKPCTTMLRTSFWAKHSVSEDLSINKTIFGKDAFLRPGIIQSNITVQS